jgi:hypothetical protein
MPFAREAASSQNVKMRRTVSLVLWLGAGLGLVALLAFALGGPPAAPSLPKPNGYDEFVAAAAAWKGNIASANPRDPSALRSLVATNAQTLRFLRLGLDRDFCLPFAITNMTSISTLVQFLAASGLNAELDQQFPTAAGYYMDTLRFGNQISRGGPIRNRVVGIGCETIGCNALVKLMPKLNYRDARGVVVELEKIDRSRVQWEEVVRNERRLVPLSLVKGFHPLAWVSALRQSWKADRKMEIAHNLVVAHERLIAAELALRSYRSENGHPPSRLDSLAGHYLRRVPRDTFSARPLVYHANGTNWLLYSVGPDGADDGGKPVGRGSASGDVFFDSPW